MYVTLVDVYVKRDHINDFIEACKLNHEASILESGNRRFDILQEKGHPEKFVLYEAYDSEEDAARHKETPHYHEWKETVEEWMAKPRKGHIHKGLYPV